MVRMKYPTLPNIVTCLLLQYKPFHVAEVVVHGRDDRHFLFQALEDLEVPVDPPAELNHAAYDEWTAADLRYEPINTVRNSGSSTTSSNSGAIPCLVVPCRPNREYTTPCLSRDNTRVLSLSVAQIDAASHR